MSDVPEPGRTYTARELEEYDDIGSGGQCCDLKLEDATTRVWLCRVEGGVTVECLIAGRWTIVDGSDYADEATVPG